MINRFSPDNTIHHNTSATAAASAPIATIPEPTFNGTRRAAALKAVELADGEGEEDAPVEALAEGDDAREPDVARLKAHSL